MSTLFEPRSILRWLPGEIVFSLASRHHELTGNSLSSTTCRELFGHGRQGSQHDFPCCIDALAARSLDLLGDPESIIHQRTVLPFYLAFRAPEDTSHAYATLRGPAIGSLKFCLGMLTSRFGASHPLKACPLCLAEDKELFGIGYWHRDHQLPGVWVCRTHRTPLRMARVKANGVGRFLWFLPGDISSGLWVQPASSVVSPALERLSALAEFSHRLCLMPRNAHFDPQQMARMYRSELHQRGLTRGEGLRLQMIGSQFEAFVRPLRQFAELEALPSDLQSAAAHVARLAREPRSGTHPLRHLTLITWLFETWGAFCESYERSRTICSLANVDVSPAPGIRDVHASRHAGLVELLRAGQSSTSAARQIGVTTTTAIAWAAKAGVEANRRPKVLKAPLRAKVVETLRLGADKQMVADQYSISLQLVTRLLTSEIGLRDAWKAARIEKARTEARNALATLARDGPLMGIKELRLAAPAAYAWVYRNDRPWLTNFCHGLPRASRGNGVRLDWDARDRRLAQLVYVEAHRLGSARSGKIALWKIYQCLPELKAKLGALDHLPLTAKALSIVTRRRARHPLDTPDLF